MRSLLKPLSPEEEKSYANKYLEGDIEARNILIERNLRLVTHVIKKYSFLNKDKDDLISIGTIGLIKAINTYNPEKGNRLAAYAAKCIDNEILMMIRNDKKNQKDISMYEPIGTDKEGNAINLLDIIQYEDVDIVEEYAKKIKIEWIKEALGHLEKREKMILSLRYGFFDDKIYTQNKIAKMMGISRSYVSRIEKKALKKLFYQYKQDESHNDL